MKQFSAFYTSSINISKQQNNRNTKYLNPGNFKFATLENRSSIIERRKKIRRKFPKSYCNCGNCTRLYHGKHSPTVQKPKFFSENFCNISVLSSRFWKHRRKFAIRKCGCNRHNSCNYPNCDEPITRTEISHHIRRNNENSASNHRTHYQHCGVPKF